MLSEETRGGNAKGSMFDLTIDLYSEKKRGSPNTEYCKVPCERKADHTDENNNSTYKLIDHTLQKTCSIPNNLLCTLKIYN